ncbi:selection and upkeep of intraepithelial T-cells protein 7-like [Hipposideros larvatus]
MMKPKSSSFFGYHVGFLVLQVVTSMSEKWIVTTPTGHLVATVGGQAELSCQLSPPRSAQHMEVGWFRGGQSKLVHLYRGGQEVRGEAAPEYVGRTEFVKEAIGKGRVTLRLHNISISDNGPYQCSFKDSDFSDVASMNLSVAALGLEMQIHVQAPGANGLMVECDSGGWFPQPQMEWRNNKGEVVPHSSKSYSKDGAGLFHMKMTLLLRDKSQGNMICYICNPLIGEGKQTNIVLADDLFERHPIWMAVLVSVPCGMVFFLSCQCFIKKESKCYCIRWLNSGLPQLLCFGVLFVVTIRCYLRFRNRASIADPLFVLYNDWIREIAVLVGVLMIFFSALIICLYLPLKGYKSQRRV